MNLPRPLISATALRDLLSAGQPPVLLDCGFDLMDPAAGERAHAAGHLPGALYVHLDRDLSGDKSAGPARGGRHPLPDREAFAACAGRWGVRPGMPVVAYDAQGGPFAARAWWLLRWLGHAEVAVLDGGPAAWLAAGGSLSDAPPQPQAQAPYPAATDPAMPTIDAPALLRALGGVRLFDARAAERFRGDVEPLDRQAGHIPGARNRFFKDNLGADGCFKPADALRAEWAALLGDGTAALTVQQCGSGVTACHNLLAMAHAGLGESTLYPGSWSEWSADPARPVAAG